MGVYGNRASNTYGSRCDIDEVDNFYIDVDDIGDTDIDNIYMVVKNFNADKDYKLGMAFHNNENFNDCEEDTSIKEYFGKDIAIRYVDDGSCEHGRFVWTSLDQLNKKCSKHNRFILDVSFDALIDAIESY